MASLERSEESLLNEYKGNVFEFIVAQQIAKHFKIEADFLTDLNSDLLNMLMTQQKFINEKASHLLKDLPILGEKLVTDLVKELSLANVTKVELCGKIALGMHDDQIAEADVVVHSKDRIVPVSIKLNKYGSYINTKSAGLKSFLSKYFCHYPNAASEQQTLNQFIEFDFERVVRSMFEHYDLTYTGSLDVWKSQGLPERPGELPEVLKELLHGHYHVVSQAIYEVLQKLYEEDKSKFIQSLMPLMGSSREDIIHANCLYSKQNENHEFKKSEIIHLHSSLNAPCEIQEKKLSASIEVLVANHILQMRVKPMKTFINGGFKLNCAIKPA